MKAIWIAEYLDDEFENKWCIDWIKMFPTKKDANDYIYSTKTNNPWKYRIVKYTREVKK